MKKMILERFYENENLTLGKIKICLDNGKILHQCFTLELPYLDNKNSISCVPKGTYKIRFRDGKKEGSRVAPYDHIEILDVPNRKWILIHRGNFHTQTRGCILVGKTITHIGNRTESAVGWSEAALSELLRKIDGVNEIQIV